MINTRTIILKTQIYTLIFVALLGPNFLSAQTFEWAKSFGGTSLDCGESVLVDDSGNVYTTGYFTRTVDFDPGVGTVNYTSKGGTDIFVQKMNASGHFLWAKTFGGMSDDYGFASGIDAFGNVYTTGSFVGTVDFDPGTGVANQVSVGAWDIFVQKMDPSGNFLWAKSMGGTSEANPYSIYVDLLGNAYITGRFGGTIDLDPGAGLANFTTAGSTDAFVQKMDPSGNFLWAKSFVGNSYATGKYIRVDTSGNVYITGSFEGTVDFDPGAGTAYLSSATEYTDVFVQKMDAFGNFLWAKRFGGSDYDDGHSIDVDALGNVYTAGSFRDTADFDPGPDTFNLISAGGYEIFVHKMDASGKFLWAKAFGESSNDGCFSISLDASANVYTTGHFRGTVDFDPGTSTANLTPAGGSDVFIHKMDSSGNFLWAKAFGGTSNDYSYCIIVDVSGNMYTTGYFEGIADFDPGPRKTTLTSVGDFDVFVQKTSQLITDIDKNGNIIQMAAYPNPSTGKVHIALVREFRNVQFELTDMQGKAIFNQSYAFADSAIFDLPETKGIYFLTIKTGEIQSVIKLIKE